MSFRYHTYLFIGEDNTFVNGVDEDGNKTYDYSSLWKSLGASNVEDIFVSEDKSYSVEVVDDAVVHIMFHNMNVPNYKLIFQIMKPITDACDVEEGDYEIEDYRNA